MPAFLILLALVITTLPALGYVFELLELSEAFFATSAAALAGGIPIGIRSGKATGTRVMLSIVWTWICFIYAVSLLGVCLVTGTVGSG
jgi:hypothetical protein